MERDFSDFRKASYLQLKEKQDRLVELSLFPEHEILELSTIEFSLREKVFLRANVTLLGGRGLKSETWLWAWANESLEDALRERARALRDFGAERNWPTMISGEPFPATDQEAWELSAVGCQVLSAQGVFRETANDTDWFFAVHGLERAQPPELYDKVVEHLINETIVEGGSVQKINGLRKAFPDVQPSVIGADLRGSEEPWAYDLHAQILFEVPFPSEYKRPLSKRKDRDLTGVNLAGARLDAANLRELDLAGACFDGAVLIDADLTRADLRNASLRGAFLTGVNLTQAALGGANFEGAELGRTLLIHTDLSEVVGLDEVRHLGPSEIGLSTLVASSFQVSPRFLKEAGVSRGLIEDLDRGKRFANTYQTCFLSYSSKDSDFARALYDALVEAGVRIFWDRFDVIPGHLLEDQLAEAIREHDRFLVVLSSSSMSSRWVRKELELVWHRKREALLPVRLCPIEAIQAWTRADGNIPDLAELYPISDFSDWRQSAAFQHQFQLLLKGLGGGVDVQNDSVAPDASEE